MNKNLQLLLLIGASLLVWGLSPLSAQTNTCPTTPANNPDSDPTWPIIGGPFDQFFGPQGNTPAPGDPTVTPGPSPGGGGGGGGGIGGFLTVLNSNNINSGTHGGSAGGAGLGGGMGTGTATITPSYPYYNAVTDITVPGVVPLAFTRVYVSSMNYDGPMGYSWDFSFNRSLELDTNAAYYYTGRGYKVQLNYTTGGNGTSVGPEYYSLTKTTNGDVPVPLGTTHSGEAPVGSATVYVVADAHGNRDVFNANGILWYSLDRNGNGMYFSYDGENRLTGVADPAHNTSLTFTLNANGRITAVTSSDGREIDYTYDTYYCLKQVDYPATSDFPSGVSKKYGYDVDNRLSSVIDENGNTILSNSYGAPDSPNHEFDLVGQSDMGGSSTITYDDTNMIVKVVDNKGFETDSTLDSNGNVVKTILHTAGLHSGEPSTYENDYAYDSNGRKTQLTLPRGNTMQWTYDSCGDVLTVAKTAPSGTTVDSSMGTQALSTMVTYTYESQFNLVATMTDPNGNVTTYRHANWEQPAGGPTSYNPNVLSITHPTTAAGTAVDTFTYNVYGQVVTYVPAHQAIFQYAYDDAQTGTTGDPGFVGTGYLTQTIKDYGSGHLNATTNYTYDSYGHVATVQDPDGNTTTIATNARDQVTEVDGASGEVVQSSYDAMGHAIAIQKQLGTDWQKYTAVYNSYEQCTSTRQYSDASTYLTTSYAYDLNGNCTGVTDPLSHTTTLAYDERNLPYLKTDALSKTTQTDFDANGNTATLTDELGHATTYTYDGLDVLEKKTFADSSYMTWKYDSNSNVTGCRTTAGNTISHTYDTRNEQLTTGYGSTITNTYDILGRLLTSTEGGTSLTYAYDLLGRNTSFTDQAGHTSTYTYDLNGNRLNSAYPTGVTSARAYDTSNRVSTIKDGSGNSVAAYTYDQLDRVSLVTLANGTTITPSIDLLNHLSSVSNALNTGNRNYSYVYDDGGKATSCTEPRGAVSYGYTNRNELNSVTEPSGSPFSDQSFTFDAAFNRSNWTLGSTSKSYTVNNLNQYTAIGTATPTWNTDGGLASYNGSTYTYDALGRVTEVDTSSSKSYYSYDPFDRRTQKVVMNAAGTVTLSTTEYHYDGSRVAVEYQGSTTWTYYLGLNIDTPVMRTDGTNKQWYYQDGLGDTSAVADNSGNLLEAYEYTAQGHCQITNGSGTVITATAIGNNILFAGRNYDQETGNYYDRARYYSPLLGRFISRDPLSGAEFSQGTNLYAYCGNDSVNATDPSGMGSPIGGAVYQMERDSWDIAFSSWVWVRGAAGSAKVAGHIGITILGLELMSMTNPLYSHIKGYQNTSINLTQTGSPTVGGIGITITKKYIFPSVEHPLGSFSQTVDLGTGVGDASVLTINANFNNGADPSGFVSAVSVAAGDAAGVSGTVSIGQNGGSAVSVGVGIGVGAGGTTSTNLIDTGAGQ